jgi:hypothetical protein
MPPFTAHNESPIVAALLRDLAKCGSTVELCRRWDANAGLRRELIPSSRIDLMKYFIRRLHDLEQDDGR